MLFNVYRMLSARDKLNIVYALFNSLHDFTRQARSLGTVSKMLYIKKTTIAAFVQNFRREGCDLRMCLKRNPRTSVKPSPLVSAQIDEQLLHTKQLQAMCHLSLRKRCELINKRYKRHITKTVKPDRLRRFYNKHAVCYKKLGV